MSSGGRLIVFAAPAGGGKTTVIRRLLEAHPDWGFSVSATTRAPRAGEADGREYHFLPREEFRHRVEAGEFLEFEEVHGDLYGTLVAPTRERLERGETVVFDLDVKGALSVKRAFPEALTIFLVPPSRALLRERLERRGTESAETLERRLRRADMELELAPRFDVRVINDDLDRVTEEIETLILSHYRTTTRQDTK